MREDATSSRTRSAPDQGGTTAGREGDGNGNESGNRNATGNDQFGQWCVETGQALATASRARIEVYLRSLLPPPGAKEAQTRLLGALERATEETPIEDVVVEVWGERLCRCETCRRTEVGRVVLGKVRAFERWGGEFDASAASFFEHTHHESSLTGGDYDGLVPPRVTAALYVDGSLAGVFPSRFGDVPYSVRDFCDAIADLTVADPASERVESSR